MLDIIPLGRESALSARQIADLLGTTPRKVTRSIEAARQRGAPICARSDAEGGYYRARDADELEAYLARRNHRARTVARATMAMRDTLDAMRDQTSLFHQNEKAAPEDGESKTPLR